MKLAMITGGSKGLGKALVELYLKKGWSVTEFSRSGDSDVHVNCDFGDPKASANVIDETFKVMAAEPWSEVVLINNAGTLNPMGPVEMTDVEGWNSNIQINLNSAIMMTGLFLKHFGELEVPKFIANISSGAALQPIHGWSLYCTAKAGLNMFTECVALEQAEKAHPTTVFSLRPGVVDTDMQQQIREQNEDQFKDVERFKQMKSENVLRSPESVAQWVFERIEANPRGGDMLNITDWD